ncbi:peptidoglycan-binding domain-containing protein, partial [Ilumatobacter sp.]|uniref:peptidoglycan-binding domain-containing protein n=1 Tax=Ilumatobacter sp. TaxID=1967498 RepID=UPI003AF45904
MSDNCESPTAAGRRPRPARLTRRVAVLALGGLLATSCGSSGNDEPSATATTDASAGQGDEQSSDGDGSTTTTAVGTTTTTTEPIDTTTTEPAGTTTTAVTTTTMTTTTTTTTTLDCSRQLELGCEGDAVVELQDLLVRGGFGNLERDGIFGPATDAALRAFEEQCGSCERDAAIDPNGSEWSELEASEPADPGFASVFDSWVGGGDPENTCSWMTLSGLPSGPTFGFGFDLEKLSEPIDMHMALRYELCFIGFDFSQPIELIVEGNGAVKNMTVLTGSSTTTA